MTLTKSEKTFSLLYFLLILLEQLSGNISSLNIFHFTAKPLLVLSLLFFFWLNSKAFKRVHRTLILLALIFSLFGDVFLMFTNYDSLFFMLGLFAFLIGHIMYILSFNKNKGSENLINWFSLIILCYGIGLFITIYSNLKSLLIPVVLYMLVILTMAVFAYLRKGAVDYFSFTLVLLGALFFLISDSLIALNKFYEPILYPKTSIMLTYAIAQYCLIIGILKNKAQK